MCHRNVCVHFSEEIGNENRAKGCHTLGQCSACPKESKLVSKDGKGIVLFLPPNVTSLMFVDVCFSIHHGYLFFILLFVLLFLLLSLTLLLVYNLTQRVTGEFH